MQHGSCVPYNPGLPGVPLSVWRRITFLGRDSVTDAWPLVSSRRTSYRTVVLSRHNTYVAWGWGRCVFHEAATQRILSLMRFFSWIKTGLLVITISCTRTRFSLPKHASPIGEECGRAGKGRCATCLPCVHLITLRCCCALFHWCFFYISLTLPWIITVAR